MRFATLIVCASVLVAVGCEHRSQTSCLSNLRMIEGAKHSWALAENKSTNDVPTWDDIGVHFKSSPLECPHGGTYTLGRVDELPGCSFPEHAATYNDGL